MRSAAVRPSSASVQRYPARVSVISISRAIRCSSPRSVCCSSAFPPCLGYCNPVLLQGCVLTAIILHFLFIFHPHRGIMLKTALSKENFPMYATVQELVDALTPEEKIRPAFHHPSRRLGSDAPAGDHQRRKGRRCDHADRRHAGDPASLPCGRHLPVRQEITDPPPPEQLAQFNADLQAASRTPLFIAVDEEGGAVRAWPITWPLICRNMRAPPRWARPATRRTLRHGADHRRIFKGVRLQHGLCA